MFLTVAKDALRTLAKVYREFSVESTIHGFKYTILAKTRLERSVWVIILLVSFLAAGRMASLFYERHQSASMSTLVISTQYSTSMLELPAITLCHGGIAMTHKVVPYLTSQKRIYMPHGLTRFDFERSLRYLREAIYPKNYFPDQLDQLQHILSANRLSLLDLFGNVNPNCSDFLLLCQLEGQTVPCSRLIEPVVTYYGICCAFNYEFSRGNLQSSTKLLKRRRSAKVGSHFVLSLLMRSYPSEDRAASVMFGDGVKVLVHERSTYPSPKAVEFTAAANHETIAQLDGTVLSSTAEVLELSARRCSTSGPQDPRPYRSDNCQIECRDSAVWKLCGCTPLSAAPAVTATQRAAQPCDLTHIPCLARAILRTHSVVEQDPRCTCLPDCEGTTYKVALASAPLNAAQHCPRPFYKKVLQYENVTALHLTFAGQMAMLQQRKLVLSNINLLSSLGGVFGLFLGCSIISVIEILYFFCISFVVKFKEARKQRNISLSLSSLGEKHN
ncbi:PREDICTED: sodium channel protein Nach-like [Dinoponera quadriceps]|uniref:Sodium channel protein Nach-like n=1 Tax=Dinoponera quadriceps TaxID=609295 RepID=A0A6P3WWS5_DINQU|nr:PREDICTED: sodium channel protein Nach-like [Dinoponera quadriceps]